MEKSLTILPKSAAFIQPSESAFYNPTLWKNRESMKLIPFHNLYFRAANGFDRVGEVFSGIGSVG